MWLTEVGAPVTSPDGNNAELGDDNGGANGGSDFLGGLDTKTNMALRISNNHDSLEAGTLTGAGLLLDGLDLNGNTHVNQLNSREFPTCMANSPTTL